VSPTATSQRAAAEQALSEVLEEFGGLIYSVCRHRLGASFAFAIEDAAAETALRLFRVIERQVAAGGGVQCGASLVRVVATRTAISVFHRHVREVRRRQKLVNETVSDAHISAGESLVASSDLPGVVGLSDSEVAGLLEALPELLDSLQDRERSLLRLHYLSTPSMTWAAIGQRLQMKTPAARQAGRRALSKLARLARAALHDLRAQAA